MYKETIKITQPGAAFAESPKKTIVTLDFQSEFPEAQRRKYWMLEKEYE